MAENYIARGEGESGRAGAAPERSGAGSERARVVFMGTPDFAVPTLEMLLDLHEVAAVFTQPDRPAGRGRTPRQSPVKQLALEHRVAVMQPTSLRKDPGAVAALRDLGADIVVVAAYGLLLPQDVLNATPGRAVNVHASLLPRWRGASPVNHAILEGDARTGATIMLLDAGWDTGPILAQRGTTIGPDETAGELTDRLATLGADLLAETLPGWLSGAIDPLPQDDAAATLAPRLEKKDGCLDWRLPGAALARRVRALQPWPGSFTTLPGGERLKVHRATAIDEVDPGPPGLVVVSDDGLAVVAGRGLLRLDDVQAAGRRRVTGSEFARGRQALAGTVLPSCEPST